MGLNNYGTATDKLSSPALHLWAKSVADSVGGIVSTSTNLSLDDTHHTVILTGTTSRTITLPAASAVAGREIVIKNMSSGTLTVGRNSASIDGVAANITMPGKGSVSLFSDGSNWFVKEGSYMDSSGSPQIWSSTSATFVRAIAGSNIETTSTVANFYYSYYFS